MNFKKKIQNLDYGIFIPFVLLILIGLIMIYSASSDLMIINNFSATSYLKKQFVALVIAGIGGVFLFSLKLKVLKNRNLIMALVGILGVGLLYLLLLRVVRGDAAAVNGAVGWINVGPLNIQPVEFGKVILILYLSFILSNRDGRFVKGRIVKELSAPAILAFAIILCVFVQPDLGGAAILTFITFSMFLMSGIKASTAIKWFTGIMSSVIILVFGLIAWNPPFLQNSYQFQRLISFVNPFGLEKSGGAQLVNSYYAIHNGGLLGVGLGNSIQKRGYLPEPYTDFILSIITEELGVLGAIAILGLLFYLMYRITRVAINARDTFNALFCYGVATMLLVQTVFNVGAVLGLLPITGVTLPFISYGGSSIMVLVGAIAIVLNIAANEKYNQFEVNK